jgi:hypothetical protein
LIYNLYSDKWKSDEIIRRSRKYYLRSTDIDLIMKNKINKLNTYYDEFMEMSLTEILSAYIDEKTATGTLKTFSINDVERSSLMNKQYQ